jgi:hypothetical protein
MSALGWVVGVLVSILVGALVGVVFSPPAFVVGLIAGAAALHSMNAFNRRRERRSP